MSKILNAAIAIVGIDIGKNAFHVVGQDERGAIVLHQKWSRGQVAARFANIPPCLIGMEACVGAHHLSRKLKELGHDARLMPAKYVRPYSRDRRTTSATRGNRRGGAAPNHEVRGDQDRGPTRSAGATPGAGAVGQPAHRHRQSDSCFSAGARHCGAAGQRFLRAELRRASWPRHPMFCHLAWCG